MTCYVFIFKRKLFDQPANRQLRRKNENDWFWCTLKYCAPQFLADSLTANAVLIQVK